MKKSFFTLMAGFALGISSVFFMSSCMADDEISDFRKSSSASVVAEYTLLRYYYEKSETLISEIIKYDEGFWDGVGSGDEYAEYLAAKKAVEDFRK